MRFITTDAKLERYDEWTKQHRQSEWYLVLTYETQLESWIAERNWSLDQIDLEIIKHVPRIPNWKTPGWDGIQRFWIKYYLNVQHNRISGWIQANFVSEWKVTHKMVLSEKREKFGIQFQTDSVSTFARKTVDKCQLKNCTDIERRI